MCIAFTGHPIAAFLNRSYSSSVISLVCTGSFSCVLSFRFILPSLFIVQFSGSDASHAPAPMHSSLLRLMRYGFSVHRLSVGIIFVESSFAFSCVYCSFVVMCCIDFCIISGSVSIGSVYCPFL